MAKIDATQVSVPHNLAWGLAAGMAFGTLDVGLSWWLLPGYRTTGVLVLGWMVCAGLGAVAGLALGLILRVLFRSGAARPRWQRLVGHSGPIVATATLAFAVLEIHFLRVRAPEILSAAVLLPNLALAVLFGLVCWSLSGGPGPAVASACRRIGPKGPAVAVGVALLSGSLLLAIDLQVRDQQAGTVAGTRTDQPNVIWLVLDTTRADALSCYGATHIVTESLDALAAGGVRFECALSAASWTLPSHASMLTGTHPGTHGLTGVVAQFDGSRHLTQGTLAETSAAQVFQDAGYATAAFSENPWVSVSTGLGPGFGSFVDTWNLGQRRFTLLERALKFAQGQGWLPWSVSRHTVASIERWLGQVGPHQPFFVFVNFLDPHSPYTPTREHRHRVLGDLPIDDAIDAAAADPLACIAGCPALDEPGLGVLHGLYCAEVDYLDERIGDLMGYLQRSDLLDDTIVVVTADHGENFGWEGLTSHAFSLNEDLLRVPLILHAPGRLPTGTTVATPVSLVDLLPTLAGLTSVPVPNEERIEGRSLLPLLAGGDPAALQDRCLFAEESVNRALLEAARKSYPGFDWSRYERALKVVRKGDRKFVWCSDGRHAYFDLGADPSEAENLVSIRTGEAHALAFELHEWVEELANKPRPISDGAWTLSPEAEEILRSIGYIE